jgi:putative DNA primase/helicase
LSQLAKGVLAYRDELSGRIRGFDRYSNGSEREMWTEGYGGRPYKIDRVKNPEPITINRLSIGLLGGLQPDVLATVLLNGDDDGFAARILYFWPERVEPRRPTTEYDSRPALEALRRLRDLMMDLDDKDKPIPTVLPLAGAASERFELWWRSHSQELPAGKFGSWWGKQSGNVLRLALVLELLGWASCETEFEPESVGEPAVAAAIEFVDAYFKPMAERTYGDASLPEEERNAITVAKWIMKTRPSKINVRELIRKARLPGLRKADPVHEALGILVDAGWIWSRPQREGSTRGRLRDDYLVNPRLWQAR